MFRTLAVVVATLSLSGCVVYGGGPGPGRYDDAAPQFGPVDASCYWDAAYGDDVWWFQADVYDAEDDTTSVTADVYDASTNQWVDSFDLYYESGNTWFSAWQQASTWLDCGYYNYYVDFTANDAAGNTTGTTLDLW